MTHKLEKQHIKKNRTIRVSDHEWESLKKKHKKLIQQIMKEANDVRDAY